MSGIYWLPELLVLLHQFLFWKIVGRIQRERADIPQILGKLESWDYSSKGNFRNYYAAMFGNVLWSGSSLVARWLIVLWYAVGLSLVILVAWLFY